MGKKTKKNATFRVDPDVLDALAAKADRLSERTGRAYSIATIVDTELSEAIARSDEETLGLIAKHQFGIDVIHPLGDGSSNLAVRLGKLTSGRGADVPRILSTDWIKLARDIPLEGLKQKDLPYGLSGVITQMLESPSTVERVLKRYEKQHGGNELLRLLYRLLDLARGDDKQTNLLTDIKVYYLCVSLFSNPQIRKEVDELIQRTRADDNSSAPEMLRRLLEAGLAMREARTRP